MTVRDDFNAHDIERDLIFAQQAGPYPGSAAERALTARVIPALGLVTARSANR